MSDEIEKIYNLCAEKWKKEDLLEAERLLDKVWNLAKQHMNQGWLQRIANAGVIIFQKEKEYSKARKWIQS